MIIVVVITECKGKVMRLIEEEELINIIEYDFGLETLPPPSAYDKIMELIGNANAIICSPLVYTLIQMYMPDSDEFKADDYFTFIKLVNVLGSGTEIYRDSLAKTNYIAIV